jgi:hypothetical protein
MEKGLVIVMAEILDIVHHLRLKNPTTFWRLDLPLSSGCMGKGENLIWWA